MESSGIRLKLRIQCIMPPAGGTRRPHNSGRHPHPVHKARLIIRPKPTHSKRNICQRHRAARPHRDTSEGRQLATATIFARCPAKRQKPLRKGAVFVRWPVKGLLNDSRLREQNPIRRLHLQWMHFFRAGYIASDRYPINPSPGHSNRKHAVTSANHPSNRHAKTILRQAPENPHPPCANL